MYVAVCSHDPKLALTADLPPGKTRSRLEKAGVVSYQHCDQTILFACSEAPNDTQFFGTAMEDFLEVLHTGSAPRNCGGEFFLEGRRLPGSRTDQGPLDDGLIDHPADQPTTPLIKSGHSGVSVVDRRSAAEKAAGPQVQNQPKLDDTNRTIVQSLRDGSTKQFQGLNAQRFTCNVKANTGCDHHDTRCMAGCGKGPHDGAAVVVSTGVGEAARKKRVPVSGSRGLAMLAACMKPFPAVPRERQVSRRSHTRYVYACYPGDGSGFQDCHAEVGYVGSASDYHYQTHPAATEGSEGWIKAMHRPCPCQPCLRGDYANCKLRHLFVWDTAAGAEDQRNKVRHYQIKGKSGAVERKKSKRIDLDAFAAKIKQGTRIAVRVHGDEPNDQGERFFVGVAIGSPCVWKNTKSQNLGTNAIRKGIWVVQIRWCHRRGAATPPTDLDGALGYRLKDNEASVVLPLEGAMHSAHDPLQRMQFRVAGGGHTWLTQGDHAEIMDNPLDLLS